MSEKKNLKFVTNCYMLDTWTADSKSIFFLKKLKNLFPGASHGSVHWGGERRVGVGGVSPPTA